MAYHCPHCQKFSYAPQAFHKLEGFAMICAHCHKAFDPNEIGSKNNIKPPALTSDTCPVDTCPVICPHCDDVLHLHEHEYDILLGHKLACLNCANSFLLPEKQPFMKEDSSARTFLKIGFLYLLILASLGLLTTPKGAALIAYLGQISDAPRQHLRSFHNIWHDFLAFIQGMFL